MRLAWLVACLFALAASARADNAAAPQIPAGPELGRQPAATATAPQAAMPAAIAPLAALPALATAKTAPAATAAAPSAQAAAPGAFKELEQGASASRQEDAQAPVELQKRFDGGAAPAKTLDQLIAEAQVSHNAGVGTFSLRVMGEAAFLQYRLRQDRLIILHTEVPTALEGHGVGSKIVKAALDYAREKGLRVNPLCPFAARYIDRHPEYQPLLARQPQ